MAGYWPLSGELDPRPGMDRLRARGHPLALPRLDGRDQPLVFLAWDAGDVLVQGTFKLLEPDRVAAGARARGGPGAASGVRSTRRPPGLWQGLLRSHARPPAVALACGPLAIGIAFADQEVEAVPMGPADVPLDGVITETALHLFAGSGAAGP